MHTASVLRKGRGGGSCRNAVTNCGRTKWDRKSDNEKKAGRGGGYVGIAILRGGKETEQTTGNNKEGRTVLIDKREKLLIQHEQEIVIHMLRRKLQNERIICQ